MMSLENRPKFVYKQQYCSHSIQLKPYCFRWIFAYRMKQLYLWLFSFIFIPFLRVARDLNAISEGQEISLLEVREKCLKPIELR